MTVSVIRSSNQVRKNFKKNLLGKRGNPKKSHSGGIRLPGTDRRAVDATENLSSMSTFVTVGDGDSDDEANGAAMATTAA